MPTSSNLTSTGATVSWMTSNDCFDQVIVRYREQGTPTWRFVASESNTEHNLTGLNNNTTYEWRVDLKSGTTSRLSPTQTFTTLCAEASTKPSGLNNSTPLNVEDRFETNLMWSSATCENDSAKVRYHKVGDTKWKFVTVYPYDSEKNIGGLDPASNYEWRVVTYAANVASANSVLATFSTPSLRLSNVSSSLNTSTTAIFPNPFNKEINITINLSSTSDVTIELFDLQGKLIENTVKTDISEGENTFNYIPNTKETGVYMLRIITNDEVINTRIIKN